MNTIQHYTFLTHSFLSTAKLAYKTKKPALTVIDIGVDIDSKKEML